ncbi:ABC transporter substrate-binding protein [Thermococcus sp. AM4]|uniref:ABC transporter substrate-binding protein n=1 Tax=Thermococcus sp. (strain AM4) TaxID=246969 RepID=UPI0001870F72|nr:ABC transporter substrate-binding protein [Thermococcus sp. AM4]EEB73629.1 ABC-type dipeptide/oligopeptide transport system, probable periplasmic component [Thermococcus sp. AM4]
MNRKVFSLFIIGLMVFSVFFVRPAAAYTDDDYIKFALQAFQTKYYKTAEDLDGILDMTLDNSTHLTTYFTYKFNNKTFEVTNADQFWDLAKINMGLGIFESPRVFLVETWTFFPANKKRIEDIVADPNVGLGTRWSPMTAKTPDGKLKIAQFASTGAMFMSAFNPVGGLTDVYSVRVSTLITDYGGATNFDGVYAPYRCTWKIDKTGGKVPDDAVIYNQTQGWIAANKGKDYRVKVTYTCDVGEWHNGVKGSIDDIKNYIAFLYTWAYQDYKGDPYYDPAMSGTAQGLKQILGFEFTDNGYTVYGNYIHPLADDQIASFYMFYPSMPWEMYWAMGELVANAKKYGIDKTYSFSSSGEGILWLDLLTKAHDDDLKTVMEAIVNGNAKDTFPGIDWNAAKDRLQADLDFYAKYHHMFISNGPYVLVEYNPGALYLKLEKFTGERKVLGDTLPKNPVPDEIEYVGVQNQQTTILEIAKGTYDIGMFAFPAGVYKGLGEDVLNNLKLFKSASSYNELTINDWHDRDKDAPIVTVGDNVYFNPFAVREVRYALNWLVSRDYIVQNIYQGSGAPMLGCIRPSHPANKYFEPVYKALGMSTSGNENYAMYLFNEGMKKAQQEVAKYGYELVRKPDGYWYFGKKGEELKPVTIKFIIRIEDERKDIGLYVARLIENKFGFKVDKLLWDRKKAGYVVFAQDPATYKWNLYTGGWGTSGLPSQWVDGYMAFFYTNWGGWTPNGEGPDHGHKNTVTVRQFLVFVGKLHAPQTTTSSSESTTTTSSGGETTSSVTTSSTTAQSTTTPTSTTTSKKKTVICGPAALIGLAIVPLLLRRRK